MRELKTSSNQVVDADRNDRCGVKHKQTKASFLFQVSFNAYLCRTFLVQSTRFIAYNTVGRKYTYAASLLWKIRSKGVSFEPTDYDAMYAFGGFRFW